MAVKKSKVTAKKTAVKKAKPQPAVRAKAAPVKAPRPSIGAPIRPIEREPMDEQALKKIKYLSSKEMKVFKDLLLRLRDRIIDEISFLANDNLNRSQRESSGDLSSYSFHMADQGTDNCDREFAANLLSSEQDVLYEINEALRRIEGGTYGVCEISGKPIERERLRVLPFVRYCVSVQSEIERGKPRFRPFRRTSIQTSET